SGLSNPYAPDVTQIEPHHFHIYATKHNTHITFTKPNRDPLLSVSTGNIGFKKGARGSYDAAYQLCAFVLRKIQEKGLLPQIREMEVVFRGFGEGRDAVRKVLMGTEGINIRGKVTKVTDATRLKFGGSRSPNPRRLG
ncbi:translational machinery component, partial [Saccharata proteae CBS 121410]